MQHVTPLKNANFLAYWAGQAFANLGDALMFVTLPFVVFAISGGVDQRVLAITLAIGSFPRLFGLLIGSLVDRLPLKFLLIFGGLLRALGFAFLALLLSWELANPALVYMIAFFNGLLAIFVQTTGNVLLPELVAKRQLSSANSLMQIAGKGVPLIGYGLAGVLVASSGNGLTLLIASGCFAVLPLSVLFISFPPKPHSAPRPLTGDLLDGVRLLVQNRLLVLASLTALLLNGAMMLLNVLIPGTMHDYGWGARGYGLFESLFGVGAMFGLVAVSTLLSRLRLADRLLVALGLGLVSYLLFAIGSPIWLYFIGSLLLGVTGGIGSVAVITLFQLATAQENRGKVLGGFSSIDAFGFTLGPLLTGWLAPVFGERLLYLGCAVLITLLLASLMRARHLPIEDHEVTQEAADKGHASIDKSATERVVARRWG